MRRREKFIICSVLLALGLFATQYVPLQYRLLSFFVFFLFSYLVSAWGLYEDLYGIEWVSIVPFPAMYGVSVGLFYFLLPDNVLSRFFILGLFGVGMYALYLTSNIYSVAKLRNIQLLRAAHTIGVFFTLLTSTLLTNFMFSLHLSPFWNALIAYGIHVPLVFMSLWSVELKPRLDLKVLYATLTVSVVLGQLALFVSFLPLSVLAMSLLLSFVLYILLGILQAHFQQRLFQNTLVEYFLFSFVILFYFFFNLHWK